MGINHTPGPWIVYGAPGNVWAPFDQENVANAYIADRDRETQSANARLIAAAPAMLAALRNLLSDMETVGCIDFYDQDLCQGVGGAVSDARAILSRIEGTPTAQPASPSGGIAALPDGFTMERDQDGDPVLIPPATVTIFSEPGEGWLVTDDYMRGRDWANDGDVIAACCEYLQSIKGER